MVRQLPSLDDLRDLVSPDQLAREGFPKPRRVVVTEQTDSSGDEAYYVWVIYPDRTPKSKLEWESVQPMQDWIWEKIRQAVNSERWPYVQVKLESHVPDYLKVA